MENLERESDANKENSDSGELNTLETNVWKAAAAQSARPGCRTDLDMWTDRNLGCKLFWGATRENLRSNIFHHYKDLKDELYKSKKLDKIKHEDFRKEQDYMNCRSIESCRTQFRVRTEMVDTFCNNFWSKYRTLPWGQEDRDPGLLCGDCGQDRDTQIHCLDCPAWAEARDRLDLHCMEDMVTYFRRVLMGREDKEKERRKWRRTTWWGHIKEDTVRRVWSNQWTAMHQFLWARVTCSEECLRIICTDDP